MRTDYLILADAVAVAEGKHYIHGGGWSSLFVPSFPAIHPVMGIAARLRIMPNELNQQHTVEVDVQDEKGRSIFPEAPLQTTFHIGHSINAVPNSEQVLPLALNVTHLQFQEQGVYTVVLRGDGQDLETSQFNVIYLPEHPE